MRPSKYGLNASSLLGGAERGPYSGTNPAACMYLRIVLRSQPVNLLMAWMLIPCRCSSFSSCTSLPLNKFRNLLRVEWAPVYHVKGWGKFNRHYGDFCTGADTFLPHPKSQLPIDWILSVRVIVNSDKRCELNRSYQDL